MAIVETMRAQGNCETVAYVIVRWRELMLFASGVADLTFQWRELLSLIGWLALALAEMSGSAAMEPLEIAAEMASVAHAHAGGNLLHTQERFVEKSFSLLHTEATHILLWRERSLSFE